MSPSFPSRSNKPGLRRTMQVGIRIHEEVSQDHSRPYRNRSFKELNRRHPQFTSSGNHQILFQKDPLRAVAIHLQVDPGGDAVNTTSDQHSFTNLEMILPNQVAIHLHCRICYNFIIYIQNCLGVIFSYERKGTILGATAYQLGNTSFCKITEVKQC